MLPWEGACAHGFWGSLLIPAFSFYEFEGNQGYLVADVSIVCGSSKHRDAQSIAWAAIFLYQIGLFALNGTLLFCAREAILLQKPTPLSRATAFLHREYLTTMYFWELMEMARRFLLVGLYVIGP